MTALIEKAVHEYQAARARRDDICQQIEANRLMLKALTEQHGRASRYVDEAKERMLSLIEGEP